MHPTTTTPKPKRADKRKPNGVIIRIRNYGNGKIDVYQPELISHIWECRRNFGYVPWTKRIQLPDSFPDNQSPKFEPVFRRARPKATRQPRVNLPLLDDDPIEEGRSIAGSDVKLPSHLPDGRVKETPKGLERLRIWSEEDEVAELYKLGLLYPDKNAENSGSGFGLDSIEHTEPMYTVRHIAKRKGRKSPNGRSEVEIPDVVDELVFVPDEIWDQISNAADWETYEFVVEDDLMSVAESWVELTNDTVEQDAQT